MRAIAGQRRILHPSADNMTVNISSEQSVLTIDLCGKLSDFSGPTCDVIIPPEGLSIAALKAAIIDRIPALRDDLNSPRTKICVNDTIGHTSTTIRATDRVAFFPPVSGG